MLLLAIPEFSQRPRSRRNITIEEEPGMVRDEHQYAFAAYGKPNPMGSSLIGYYMVDRCHGRVLSFTADEEYHSPLLEKRMKELKTKIQKELKKRRS